MFGFNFKPMGSRNNIERIMESIVEKGVFNPKKMTFKVIRKAFKHIPEEYLSIMYSYSFISMLGWLLTYDNVELHMRIMDEFQSYLNRCEEIIEEADKDSRKPRKETRKVDGLRGVWTGYDEFTTN